MRLFVLAIVVLGIALVSYVRAPAHEDIARMENELRELRGTLATIRARNRELAREAAQLRDHPAAIEKVARQRFGLVRADEWVLPSPATTTSPAADTAPRSALATDKSLARSDR